MNSNFYNSFAKLEGGAIALMNVRDLCIEEVNFNDHESDEQGGSFTRVMSIKPE